MMKNSLTQIEDILRIRETLKQNGEKVVFTNGCFDILHAGHVDYLIKSKQLGDILIVGLNSDSSVKNLKGASRPIINQFERAYILKNLKPVDFVVLFNESTPESLIGKIVPDILVKGSDWKIEEIVGREIVEKSGGEVKTIDFITSQSTSRIIKKVLSIHNGK